jgi:hypothetical protein
MALWLVLASETPAPELLEAPMHARMLWIPVLAILQPLHWACQPHPIGSGNRVKAPLRAGDSSKRFIATMQGVDLSTCLSACSAVPDHVAL